MIAFVEFSYYVQRGLAHGGLCLRVNPIRSYSLLVEKKTSSSAFCYYFGCYGNGCIQGLGTASLLSN